MSNTKLENIDNEIRNSNLRESGMRLADSDEGLLAAELFLLKERTELYPEYRSIKNEKRRHIEKLLGIDSGKIKTLTLRTLVDLEIEYIEITDFPNAKIHYVTHDGDKGIVSIPLFHPKRAIQGLEYCVFGALEKNCYNADKNDFSGKQGLHKCYENLVNSLKKEDMLNPEYSKILIYHSVFQGDGEIPELRQIQLLFSHESLLSYLRYYAKMENKTILDVVNEKILAFIE